MLMGPNNKWKWVESNLDGDENQGMKSGLYFGGNTTQVKVLSMDDMMKAVHFKEILICYK